MKHSFISGIYYIVDYLLDGIQQRHVFKLLDAANGVVFDAVPDREDWIWGQRSTGQVVELPMSDVLMVETYDVRWQNNQGSGRGSNWTEDTVTEHLANCPTDKDGVVDTPLTSIRTSSGDRVYSSSSSTPEPEPEPKAKQGWLW
jgi:hypothetical protein